MNNAFYKYFLFIATKYTALLALLTVTFVTVVFERFEMTFTTLLLTVATVISVSQACFSYGQNTDNKALKKSLSKAGAQFVAAAIWTATAAMAVGLYFVFQIYLQNTAWYSSLFRVIVLTITAINLLFAVSLLNTALNKIEGVLFDK